jgi:signal recognition particle subunit SRP54
LQTRLGGVFERLRGRGALTEGDVDEALGEVRNALIEADVALPVVKTFIDKVRPRAIGEDVIRSVTPGQQVVKIVHDVLVETLGEENAALNLGSPPAPILMVGLQGSGKTTTSAIIGLMLQTREKKRVLMASLDVSRPAAMEQLRVLGEQAGVATLPIVLGQGPLDIARRALASAKVGGYDALILDTAGRQHIDEELMREVAAIRDQVKPHETLLVADSLTGQDAVNIAKSFNDRVALSGIILSRADGDARGGAALSVRHVTGKPIKFAGVAEKLEGLEPFHPERMAARILGMGDILSLVEEAHAKIDLEEAQRVAEKVKKGKGFDLEDFKQQIVQMKKMGGVASLMDKLPAQLVGQIDPAKLQDEKQFKRIEGIINAMTPQERRKPELIKASRKRRIATGAGVSVQAVNQLLNQFEQMQKMMKMMKGGNFARMMRGMKGMLPGIR